MATTPNLGITHIEASQNNKHVTHNEDIDDLDEAGNDTVNISIADSAGSPTTADVTLSSDEFNRNYFIRLRGSPTIDFTVTLPANKRTFCISNETGQQATITTGAGGSPTPETVAIAGGNRQELYSDAVSVFARAAAVST